MCNVSFAVAVKYPWLKEDEIGLRCQGGTSRRNSRYLLLLHTYLISTPYLQCHLPTYIVSTRYRISVRRVHGQQNQCTTSLPLPNRLGSPPLPSYLTLLRCLLGTAVFMPASTSMGSTEASAASALGPSTVLVEYGVSSTEYRLALVLGVGTKQSVIRVSLFNQPGAPPGDEHVVFATASDKFLLRRRGSWKCFFSLVFFFFFSDLLYGKME